MKRASRPPTWQEVSAWHDLVWMLMVGPYFACHGWLQPLNDNDGAGHHHPPEAGGADGP